MSRAIKDSIVMERTEGLDFDEYTEVLAKYSGNVTDTLRKAKISNTLLGIRKVDVTDSVRSRYASCRVTDEDKCRFVFEGVTDKQVSSEVLRMLKALALEQINKNEEYSQVVFKVIQAIMIAIVRGDSILTFEEQSDLSPMQQYVYKKLSTYVQEELITL